MSSTHDIAVIGGGIVGLAVARGLLSDGRTDVVVLEAEARVATHQTGHNSGVIHSGLYYAPGSLKARNCVAGREELYRYCESHAIPHERCGKLVVAVSDEQVQRLDELERRGRANGLAGLERLDGPGLREIEPHVTGIAGLRVPDAGIVDFRQVAEALAFDIRERNGQVRTGFRVLRVVPGADGFVVETTSGTVETRHLINCAGLQSDRVARMCGEDPGLRIVPFRGEYFRLRPDRRRLVRNLIYPVPDPAFPFLGVHFTRTVDGDVEAGPNALPALSRHAYARWSFSPRDTLDMASYPGTWRLAARYRRTAVSELVRSLSRRALAADLRRLIPDIEPADLERAGAGVRAQALDPAGNLIDDFRILERPRSLHVLSAPSPAATAALSIGRTVATLAAKNF